MSKYRSTWHLEPKNLDEGYRTVGNEKGTEFKVFKDGKLIKTFPTYIQAHDYVKQQKENLDEFTTSQLNTLKKSYAGMMNKTISPEKAIALSKALDKLDLLSLRQLNKEKIPFISTVARNKIYKKTGKFEEVELEEQSLKQKAIEIAKKMAGNMTGAVREIEKLMKGLSKDPVVATTLKRVNENKEIVKDNEKKEAENKDTQIRRLIDQIAVLKQKLENEKNKAVKPEPNPDTGEVPLTVGVAYKHLKDKKEKQ